MPTILPWLNVKRSGGGWGTTPLKNASAVDTDLLILLSETGFTIEARRLQFDLSILAKHIPFLLEGTWLTFKVCLISVIGSLVLGLLVAAARTSSSTFLNRLSAVYVDMFRNIPFIVQLFFFYFGLPEIGIYIDALATGIIALSIAGGAFTSDVIRSGILAIEPGVIEAAQVSGLKRATIFRRIALPIALRTSVRPLGSVFINLILTSSVLSTITLNELTGSAKIVASQTFRPFEVYFVLLVAYAALTWSVSIVIGALHRHLNRNQAEGVA